MIPISPWYQKSRTGFGTSYFWSAIQKLIYMWQCEPLPKFVKIYPQHENKSKKVNQFHDLLALQNADTVNGVHRHW